MEEFNDWPSEELKDQGLSILDSLQSMGFRSFLGKTVLDASMPVVRAPSCSSRLPKRMLCKT